MRAGGSQSPAPINLSSGSVFSMAWKTSMHMPLTLARPSTIELMNLGSELICAVVRISVTAAAPPAHSDDSRHIELTICRSGFMAMISWMGGLLRVARRSENRNRRIAAWSFFCNVLAMAMTASAADIGCGCYGIASHSDALCGVVSLPIVGVCCGQQNH